MSLHRDPYETLGLPKDASSEEVRNAYRRMVKIYHPDVSGSPHDSARFRAVTDAYEALCDGRLTGQGDRIEINRSTSSPTGRRTEPFQEAYGRHDSRGQRRPDFELAAVISTHEALFGGSQHVRTVIPVRCPECGGDFFASWFCRSCAGAGEIGTEVDFVIDIPTGVSHGTTSRIPIEVSHGWNRSYLEVEVTFLIDRTRG